MSEMESVELASNDIILWRLDAQDAADPQLTSEYRALLTAEERAQEQRFYFPEGRLLYLLTRALVRTTLSRIVPVEPANWVFTKTYYGRPEIANEHPSLAGLVFNISHTKESIVLAVTRDRALGVDIESLNRSRAGLDLAERVFTPNEVAALRALPEALHRERFLELWTLKESYIKALGMGLSLAPDRFGFDLPSDGSLRLYLDADLNDDPARWEFAQYRPSEDLFLAICHERSGAAPRIQFRQILPLRWERSFECSALRQTMAS